MKILVTGICGFVGSTLARALHETGYEVVGFDNFIRPGSETNREPLTKVGITVLKSDLRDPQAMAALPAADFVLDAAANPSVLAGVDGKTSSRELVDHNLTGTINILEYCRLHQAGFILLSTSRVYSIPSLANMPTQVSGDAFVPDPTKPMVAGLSSEGLDEGFSTIPPISLYGATKLASETMAFEYGETYGFPVFVNRCGVLAGAGQFGRADQGIFAFWLNSWLHRRPLKYIGFGGQGFQVRDCLHPLDLLPVLIKQFKAPKHAVQDRIANFAGGADSAMSLRKLSQWCENRWGKHQVLPDGNPRPFDIPWLVLDSRKARRIWDWAPQRSVTSVLSEIANHAERNPNWLDLSNPH